MAKSGHSIVSGPRWLLRIAVTGVVVALLMAAAWAVWLHKARQRCDQAIAAIRARGEIVTWDELKIPTVPDAQNSAWFYRQAGSVLVGGGSATQPSLKVGSSKWLTAAKANVANNAQALALVRQARMCTQTCWAPKPVSGPPIPMYTNMSALAKLARDAALLHHVDGDDAKAVECWRDIDAQARSIGSGPVLLIGGLVSLIVDGIGLDALDQIVPDLHIGGVEGVSREEVRGLMASLANEAEVRETVARGFLSERTNWTDNYLKAMSGKWPGPAQPLLLLQMKRLGDVMERSATDVREMKVSPTPIELDECDRIVGIIPQFTSVSSETNRNALQRRVLILALAIRLHYDETGRYPERLEELVSTYAKSIPVDPRRGDGGPLGYLLEAGGTRPVIYTAPSHWQIGDIRKGLPRTRVVIGSSSLQPDSVGFFDVSAWVESSAASKGVDDHAKQSNIPRKSDQPDGDGKQK